MAARYALGICTVIWLVVLGAGCGKKPPADAGRPHKESSSESKAEADKTQQTPLPWLIVNCRSMSCITEVEINGNAFRTYKQTNAAEYKPSPLKEGQNTIFIRFSPVGEPVQGAIATFQFGLGREMMGAMATKPLDVSVENAFAEWRVDYPLKDGRPENVSHVLKIWRDKEHARLEREVRVETQMDTAAEYPDRQWRKLCNDKGALFAEDYQERGVLRSATTYRPDGAVGAEVKDGAGFIRFWFDDGTLAYEAAYENGEKQGAEKAFYPSGKLRQQTEYRQGVRMGETSYEDE